MKIRNRLVSGMVAATVLLSSLAGCQGSSNQAVATSSAPQQSSSAAEQKDLSGTININVQAETGGQEGWSAVADSYMKLHPKVKVVVDLKPTDGYGDWIQNMFGSSNPTADIVNVNMASAAKTGKDINFMDYANDTNPYTGKKWTDGINFQMQSKDIDHNTWDNISLESVQVLWCYNKDIFAKVGVEPPKTWDDLVSICDKLQKAGYQPLAVPGDFDSFWSGQMGWLAQIYTDQTTRSMINTYRAQKGDFDYDPTVDGSFKFDPTDPFNDDPWKVNTNTVRAFKAIKDGTYKPDSAGMKTIMTNLTKVFPKYAGGDAFFGTKQAGALPLFYQGKAAIWLDTGARLPMFKRDMDLIASGASVTGTDSKAISGVQKFSMGTFNMPSMSGDGIEAPARTIEVALGFVGAVKKDQAHNDLVTDFLMYWSSPTGQSEKLAASLKAGGLPSGPSLVTGVELPTAYADMFKDLKFIGNVQKGDGVLMARGAPNDVQQSLRDWYDYTQQFFNSKITVDKWAQEHKSNVMKYLNDSLKAAQVNLSDLDNPQNAPTGK